MVECLGGRGLVNAKSMCLRRVFVCVARQHHGPPRLNPMYAGYAGGQPSDMNGRVEEIARALYAAVSLRQNL